MTTQVDTEHIDGILTPYKETIGADLQGYRNHVVRMATFCLMLRSCTPEEQQKIEIAACFHDIGIWTAGTLDYLSPSVPPAQRYLAANDRGEWSDEIAEMILEHHRLRPIKDGSSALVELFRKGDLVDFSLGLFRSGLSRADVRAVMKAYPNAGFHRTLARLAGRWALKHPLNPAPMMKW